MSESIFTTRPSAEGEITAILGRYLAPATASFKEINGGWASMVGAFAQPDLEKIGGADGPPTVLVGRPVFRGPGTTAAGPG